MKISLKAESQEEFDSKRADLIKVLAGSKLKVKISQVNESSPEEKKEPYYLAQRSMLDHWNAEYDAMLNEIKRDISKILNDSGEL